MDKVKVYRFERYDINTDEYQRSRRWATLEAIEKVCARPIGEPADVDPDALGREVEGMTARNFDPYSTGAFPQTVKVE